MAQALISGNSLTIKSAIKYEDIKLLMKYAPSALSVYDEDGAEVFKIDATDGLGSVSQYGISFSGASLDGSGKAIVTLDIPSEIDTEAVVDFVEDRVGTAVDYLNAIEEDVPGALDEVQARRAAIRTCINVVG